MYTNFNIHDPTLLHKILFVIVFLCKCLLWRICKANVGLSSLSDTANMLFVFHQELSFNLAYIGFLAVQSHQFPNSSTAGVVHVFQYITSAKTKLYISVRITGVLDSVRRPEF
jgi:hypothetical protein